MATKRCPYCAEEIQQEAIKCKHCGSWLAAPSPGPRYGPPRVLLRSATDRMLAGVCGGIAQYLGGDPTLVRVLFALITVFTAIIPGLITYLVLWIVIPEDQGA